MTMIGPAQAQCAKCELKDTCADAKHAYGVSPTKPFNGIMIVLDAPVRADVLSRGGERNQLLRKACVDAGLDFDACYVTYATLALTKPISDFEKGCQSPISNFWQGFSVPDF